MTLHCGLENEGYKYTYGVNMKNEVPFNEEKSLLINVAKNDWAAAQLLLYSDEDMLVSISDDPTFYKKGHIQQLRITVEIDGLNREDIQTNLIGLVKDDDTQLKSDILLKEKHIYVKALQVQPIFIQVKTKKDTLPSKYIANIAIYSKNMFEDEELIKTLSYDINILDYMLGDPCDNTFYLDLWQHNSNIARKYDMELWSDEHFSIIENYVKSLAALGQKAISIIASEVPWSGQGSSYDQVNDSDLYEYSMVKVTYTKNGKWIYDFSAMKTYIDLCMKYGITEEIEVFGLSNIWLLDDMGFGKIIDDYPDGIRIRYYDEEKGIYKFINNREQLVSYIKALEGFFIENNWDDKARIIADEPADVDEFKFKVEKLNEIAPSFKFKVAINHVEFMGEDISNVTDYCPSITCIAERHEQFNEMKEQVKGRISYYVCCSPAFPNTFICSPLIESRLIPWVSWYLNIDGFLRWNYTVWPEDPLNKITYRYPVWPAGDTNFVYPGKDGKPLLSLRYMNLKRGIRDFEIINRYVEKYKDREEVLKMLHSVFYHNDFLVPQIKREDTYSLDYDAYEDIINKLLNKLVK